MMISAFRFEEFRQWLDVIQEVVDVLQFLLDQPYTKTELQAVYINHDSRLAILPGLEGVDWRKERWHIIGIDYFASNISEIREHNLDIRSYLKVVNHPEHIFLNVGKYHLDRQLVEQIRELHKLIQIELSASEILGRDPIKHYQPQINTILTQLASTPSGMKMAYNWYSNQKEFNLSIPSILKKPVLQVSPITIQMVETKFRKPIIDLGNQNKRKKSHPPP
jgi:hypothetical protein